MAKTYDLKRVVMTVNGVPVSGFADGDACNAEFNEDAWTLTVGADGEGVRSKSNDRSGRITFNLLASSTLNGVFEALRKADDLSNTGQAAIYIKDLASGTQIFAAQAWVVKAPNVTFAEEAGEREWVFETANLIVDNSGIELPV